MRPGNMHQVNTLEPSVCHGGHFYCSSTIADTVYSIYHQLFNPWITNHQHHSSQRRLLVGILAFYHNNIVDDSRYIGKCDGGKSQLRHLPNLLRARDFVDLLTLINLMDIGTIVWPERYTSSQRIDPMDARILDIGKVYGYKIVAYLNRTFSITCPSLSSSPGSPKSFFPSLIRHKILAKQCVALVDASGKANTNPDIKPDELWRNLMNDFALDCLWTKMFLEIHTSNKFATFAPYPLDDYGEVTGLEVHTIAPGDPQPQAELERKLGVHLYNDL